MTSSPASEELLYVLVPCLNEERGVARTVEEVVSHSARLPLDVRVIMIDDGSTDRTREEMQKLAEKYDICSVRSNDENLGMGRAVRETWLTIDDGSWVTVLPGDGELVFSSIDAYVEVRDQYDLILGYLRNPVIRGFRRRLASSLFTRCVNSLYGFPWRYLNGMKMYRVEIFKGIPLTSSGHAFNAELIAKAQLRNPHLRIGEVPFMARGRAAGTSKAIRPGSIVRAVRDVAAGFRSVSHYRREIIHSSGIEELEG